MKPSDFPAALCAVAFGAATTALAGIKNTYTFDGTSRGTSNALSTLSGKFSPETRRRFSVF